MKKVILPQMIDSFRKEKGWTMKELGSKMGKAESTVSLWIKGKRSPMVGDFDKLVTLFETDSDTLMYGANPNSNKQLLDNVFSQLNELSQEKVLSYSKEQLEEQKASNIINLQEKEEYIDDYVTGLVSAGSGVWQYDNINDEIRFPKSVVPEQYDTIARVVGRSMQPVICDNDFLFIRVASQIDFNQIGIFQVNGENFVKKLRRDNYGVPYLESINDDYEDIYLFESDEVRTIGEVVSIYRK